VSHKVSTFPIGISGYGRVLVHNHELLEGDKEVHSFVIVTFKEVGWVSLKSGSLSVMLLAIIKVFSLDSHRGQGVLYLS
jgi:hypothetical protein